MNYFKVACLYTQIPLLLPRHVHYNVSSQHTKHYIYDWFTKFDLNWIFVCCPSKRYFDSYIITWSSDDVTCEIKTTKHSTKNEKKHKIFTEVKEAVFVLIKKKKKRDCLCQCNEPLPHLSRHPNQQISHRPRHPLLVHQIYDFLFTHVATIHLFPDKKWYPLDCYSYNFQKNFNYYYWIKNHHLLTTQHTSFVDSLLFLVPH